MKINYKLYLHTAPNGKRYYGITKQEPRKRWKNGTGYKGNQHFARAIDKYGWDNIKHEVLFDNLTESEAKELEQYMIQWYDTSNRKYGYNISLGGEGCNVSEETKCKISKSRKGLYGGKNNPKAKSVICITTKQIFLTAQEGADYYNTQNTNISSCCKGRLKSAGKYNGQKLVWRYLNHRHNKIYRISK